MHDSSQYANFCPSFTNFQFWKDGPDPNLPSDSDIPTVPDEWLDADIKQGISNSDVESRRKRFGWNEISTEKENLFLKFLSYFTGPILYGTLNFESSHQMSLFKKPHFPSQC